MGDRLNYREEEQDVDFSDTRQFALTRWADAISATQQSLSCRDWDEVTTQQDWQTLQADIRRRTVEREASATTRRLLNHLQPLPRTLTNLLGLFTKAITPHEPDFSVLWGLLSLNIKLSCLSIDKLTRTVGWAKKLRSVVELLNRCLDSCEDMNEARFAMVDVLELTLQVLGDSVKHLRGCPTDAEAANGWKTLELRVNENLDEMETVVKHLNDITSYSKVNQERQVKSLSLRHGPVVLPEEHCTFPLMMISRQQNKEFYGRTDELERINRFLDHRSNPNLRTYTIYGRRGVGKTDIALEYAYSNPSGFEAIFWIQCETSLSLRQSFTDMAVQLNIPGADRDGHHEENQLSVQKWLKTTKRQWLLIFDNAERESILRGYWPLGANGAILITSRKYYNFMNDAQRSGDTLKPFNDRQSWDLLMKFLGPQWQDMDKRGLLKSSEERAAKELLNSLGGLALAIQQAAQLIKNDNIGGFTIASTYESFKEHKRNLPPRPAGDRSDIIHSLDSLWNMTFTHLTRNARHLLSVLSLLSPDGILIDLFLPRNQSALDGKLHFCKQHPKHVDPASHAALSSVILPPPPLQAAIAELVDFRLIKQERRELWAHRVVQEAMNYHSIGELQDYFDSASALVYEAFPKQVHGDYFTKEQQGACQSYVPHAAHLSLQFNNLHRASTMTSIYGQAIRGSHQFISLMSNSAWYLYEISDYEVCLRLVETARLGCEDKTTLQYALLCSVAGSAYYELNKLSDCRKNWDMSLKIQEALLPDDNIETQSLLAEIILGDFANVFSKRSNSYHNMGQLESATQNPEKAMEYLRKAIAIRIDAGDTAAGLLANSYLCLSRAYIIQGKHEAAINALAQSEALYFRTAGADAHFMSHVHYTYGNIEYAGKRWRAAKRCYEESLKIGLATSPIHPITAAAYYSLGCVEYELGNMDNAKGFLDKSLAIAQLRSPDRDDGIMARILWKTSVVLESDTFGSFAREADYLRIRAEVARRTLMGRGEGGDVVISIDEDGNPDADENENSYDALVPLYFR